MRKITYQMNSQNECVTCDMSVARADIVLEMYHDYTVTIPGLEGVVVAGPSLLLADKIRTYAERSNTSRLKKISDMADITFCLELMAKNRIKMDSALRGLYSVNQWEIVKARLAKTPHGPEAATALINVAEKQLEVIAPLGDSNAVEE